jgi:sec-independent protein translocase protein TatA
MPIPGVGFPEVAIILIAALLIFGPSKLPEVMGQAGKAIRDFRKMTGNLQGEFERNLNEVAGTDVRKTLSNEIASLKGEVQSRKGWYGCQDGHVDGGKACHHGLRGSQDSG